MDPSLHPQIFIPFAPECNAQSTNCQIKNGKCIWKIGSCDHSESAEKAHWLQEVSSLFDSHQFCLPIVTAGCCANKVPATWPIFWIMSWKCRWALKKKANGVSVPLGWIYKVCILCYQGVDLSKCQKANCDASSCQLKPVSTSGSLTPGVSTHFPSLYPFSIVYLSSILTCAFHSCQTWSRLAGGRTWVSAQAGNGRESWRAAHLPH